MSSGSPVDGVHERARLPGEGLLVNASWETLAAGRGRYRHFVSGSTDPRPAVWTGHVLLLSADTSAAARFYERIGMRPVHSEEQFAVLEMRGGTHLAIRQAPEGEALGPVGWDLMVDDLDATHRSWQSEGLAVGKIEDGPPHRSFEVTDPDGHVLVVRDSHVVGPV